MLNAGYLIFSLSPMSISNLLRSDLASTMPVEWIFQKHIVDGKSFFFNDVLDKCDWEYELRDELASVLGTNINDVVIVGSSKLGFSVKTERFNEFDSAFAKSKNPRKKSDIDIAIVHHGCFDKISKEIFSLSRHFDSSWIKNNWRTNAFNNTDRDLASQYMLYLAKGWLRPDFLPVTFYTSAAWLPVLQKWSKRLDERKISMGFYSEWYYLKNYQIANLERLRILIAEMEI